VVVVNEVVEEYDEEEVTKATAIELCKCIVRAQMGAVDK
jgi:hypothetical protein